MNLIAAVDNNWAIGHRGGLLVSIPYDQKQLRQMTMGKVIVYGRKTLATFPQQQPLSGRTNLVLSGDTSLHIRGAEVVHSIEELLHILDEYESEDVYVLGGESVYHQLLPYCDVAHITMIDYEYQADAHLENLALSPDWRLAAEGDELTYFDLEYHFMRYERVAP